MMAPACMTDTEYAAWAEKNEAIPKPDWRASSPCIDCPHWFAREQRALGTCDGMPGRPWRGLDGPPSSTAEYKRQKSRAYRRRQGMIDYEAHAIERIELVTRMRAAGLKNVEIARRLGVHRQTVSRYLKRVAS